MSPINKTSAAPRLGAGQLFFAASLIFAFAATAGAEKPAVLFIAIDDMNDWTTLFDDENPIQTPNLKRLAARGCFFTRAYCASPGCNPSRTAIMSGLRPTTSGVYSNRDPWREKLPDAVTLPQYFEQHGGYATRGAGKIYHHGKTGKEDPENPSFQEFFDKPAIRGPGPGNNYNGYKPETNPRLGRLAFDWGEHDQKMIDVDMCEWVEARMDEAWDRPLFLAAGIFNPHLPFYAPKETFARYPLEKTVMPPMPKFDLDDVGEIAQRMVRKEYWIWDNTTVQEPGSAGGLQRMVQCYQAAADYADQMVGRLLDKLDESGRADNTMIVLWSDHGYHLGDKETCVKFTLWEKANRVPLIIVAPGVTTPGTRCDRTVGLIDIYPTLVELAGLPAKEDNDGQSLVPLLKNPDKPWARPALMTEGPGNHAIRSDRWRYIRYSDGAEELYDHPNDPWEWRNLAGNPEYAEVIAAHRKWLPEQEAPGQPAPHLRNPGAAPQPQGKRRAGTRANTSSGTGKLENAGVARAKLPVSQSNLSQVPKFTFADTLEEQEKQLAENQLLARFASSREQLQKDPHFPLYHFVSPENRLNDPNGLSFWQGRWHLFYQGYPPEDPRQHWGHAVSDDLIHWRDLPYAIYPGPERACFSGSTLVEDDRVIAMYHGTTVGSMVAVSDDPLLLNWEKVTGQAVIPETVAGAPPLPNRIFDPCIWKKDDFYYALTAGQLPNGPGGKRVRAEFLHRSKDLATWEYLHPFLEDDHYGMVGDDGACPYFWPIGDRHILIHYSHTSGAKYLLGDYDTERDKFVVTDGNDFNFGPSGPSGVHAPSACPDGQGGVIVIFNMNPGYVHEGWNQIMSLPRRLTLAPDDEFDPIRIEPTGEIPSLRYDHRHVDDIALPANEEVVLEGIAGNSMELIADIDPRGAQMVELSMLRSPDKEETTRIKFFPARGYRHREYGRDVERARKRRGAQDYNSIVCLDTSYSSVLPDAKSRAPETAQLMVEKGELLRLHVFVDKSVIEVFVNGKQCLAARVYPGRKDSVGVSLRAQGRDAMLKSLDAWQLKSIYK